MNERSEPLVWLITGCSKGLGRALVVAAAEAGDRVVATSRRREDIEDLGHAWPAAVEVGALDVSDPEAAHSAVADALDAFGRVDVLVNNAGYGLQGGLEEVTEREIRDQFESNVFGALWVTRAVLPVMRRQRSGYVINITSIGGIVGFPASSIYNATKFALEGLGESLAKQVAPLGIKVTNVEPGPFRTEWAGESMVRTQRRIPDYDDTVGEHRRSLDARSGRQPGDPARAAEAMVALTRLAEPPLHLPLGAMAFQVAREHHHDFLRELDDFEALGKPTDFPRNEQTGSGH